jgi:hypothetical protein
MMGKDYLMKFSWLDPDSPVPALTLVSQLSLGDVRNEI